MTKKDKFKSTRKGNFLENLPTISIENPSDHLTELCKFNFHYMDFSQEAGQTFKDWSHDRLYKLQDKLKEFCAFPLKHWTTVKMGGGGKKSKKKKQNVLEIYGNFPTNTDFVHPKAVPHEVQWARFRLGSEARLIGFVLPIEFCHEVHKGTKINFDCNTFYVVFLDKDHRFYKTE